MEPPVLYMIAGPNGAGKTTLAFEVLQDFFSIHEFVNADEIARGLSPFNPNGQAVAAGRLMLRRIDDLISSRKSFAFETTGASRVFAEKLKQAKEAGFKIGLFYVWLPDAEIAKHRVRLRVLQGGHDIPENTVERRYIRGLRYLMNLYLPLADELDIYDGAVAKQSVERIIAEKRDKNLRVYKTEIWDHIMKLAKEKDDRHEGR